MTKNTASLTKLAAWQALEAHYPRGLSDTDLYDLLFTKDKHVIFSFHH